ncbi:hypothetical protein BZB76_2980 [Actinomadura pelletieri DSM 43383]|uniref:Uncharacterized protein n=1 Tax=Actinomadura pelletieri DSM 43383 TaxID=1120940 RepID=A0A495QNF7_9ACTN|nr:hypothetical protein BZB76_2980 [Actinomadura pelletieri DSM 43383]
MLHRFGSPYGSLRDQVLASLEPAFGRDRRPSGRRGVAVGAEVSGQGGFGFVSMGVHATFGPGGPPSSWTAVRSLHRFGSPCGSLRDQVLASLEPAFGRDRRPSGRRGVAMGAGGGGQGGVGFVSMGVHSTFGPGGPPSSCTAVRSVHRFGSPCGSLRDQVSRRLETCLRTRSQTLRLLRGCGGGWGRWVRWGRLRVHGGALLLRPWRASGVVHCHKLRACPFERPVWTLRSLIG